MDTNELLQQTYQKDLSEAIGIAGKYEGTEDQFQILMKHLIAVEDAVNSVIDNEKPADPKTEREVLKMVVDDVLSIAIETFYKRIKELLTESVILCKKLKGVLLPPGNQPVILGDGTGEFEESRFHGRLEELIGFLHDNGIYTDDIVVCFGERYENMMRQLSYALVEIPRLNRQILVCDQIGESTFVIDGIFNRETLLKLSKEKLQEQYPGKVRRIIYNNTKQWLEELIQAVFYEWKKEDFAAGPQKNEPSPKIDVKKREEIMEKIKEKYTSQQFMELTPIQRRGKNLAGTGLGLIAIATIFDVEDNPLSNKSAVLQLAQKIYGEDDPTIKHAIDMQDPDKLKNQIKKVYTSQQFVELQVKQRLGKDFARTGLGVTAITRLFDIEGNPLGNNSVYLQLAQKIYGEDDLIVKHAIDMQDPDKLKAQIKKIYPTSQQFIKLTQRHRLGKDFAGTGLGLMAIATIFDVKDNPFDHNSAFLQFAQKIYGEDDLIVKRAIDIQNVKDNAEKDPDKIKAKIKKLYPISKQFMELTIKQKQGKNFAETGLGLNAIARIFDVEGNPTGNTSVFLQLVQKIYGDNDPVVQHAIDMQNPDKLKTQIKKIFTSQQLIKLTVEQKLGADFAETGLGLVAIARIFSVEDDPCHYNSVLLNLTQKIYGEDDPVVQHAIEMQNVKDNAEKDPDKIKTKIKKLYPISKQFVKLTSQQRKGRNFAETGLGLYAIATIFDVKGNPVGNTSVFLQLVLKIYGE